MPTYAGLDVSESKTHICVLDERGRRLKSAAIATDPANR